MGQKWYQLKALSSLSRRGIILKFKGTRAVNLLKPVSAFNDF
jgi:hypothetical protein